MISHDERLTARTICYFFVSSPPYLYILRASHTIYLALILTDSNNNLNIIPLKVLLKNYWSGFSLEQILSIAFLKVNIALFRI